MTKKETLDDLKQTIVETSAEAVVATMTPAMMRKCAEGTLATVLSSISGNQYGDLGRMVRDKAEKAMKEYLETDEAKALINATVRRSVNDAVKNLDERLSVEVLGGCMSIKFKATLETGEVVVGPIQGNGGRLGSGALHAGRKAAAEDAMKSIRLLKKLAARGEPLPVYEPEPGMVAMYPHETNDSPGTAVIVPLEGTTFELAEEP